jgi:hypothetical protein
MTQDVKTQINFELPLGAVGCGPFYYIFGASDCMLLIVLSFNITSSVLLTSLPQYNVLIAREFPVRGRSNHRTVRIHATMFLCRIYYRILSQHATDSGLVSHFLLGTCRCLR